MPKCPLTGKLCNMPRVVHVTDIKHGKVEEMHLCQLCAGNVYAETPGSVKVKPSDAGPQNIPVNTPDGHPELGNALGEFLDFLMKSMQAKGQIIREQEAGPCPSCGSTLQDIGQTKRLGCPTCYTHFSKELTAVLHSVQGGLKHVGKVPKRWAEENKERLEKEKEEADIHERIRLLKLKQAQAIEVENYEAAGVLKTKIKELESQLNDSEEPTPPSSEDQ